MAEELSIGEQLVGPQKNSVILSGKSLIVATDCGLEDEVIIYVTVAFTGTYVLKYVCDSTLPEQRVDISNLPSGTYVGTLMMNGVVESSLTFIL